MNLMVCENASTIGDAVCEVLKPILENASNDRRPVSIGLSGGSMAQILSPKLASLLGINWELVHFFYCDERLVPLEDERSNHLAYAKQLYPHINIPVHNVHTVSTSLPLIQAASDYQSQLMKYFEIARGYPCFDVLLLGMGPDGHTCSLFPNHNLLSCEDLVVAPISDSPKPPPERVTLTLPVLNKAKNVIFMVAGADKVTALRSTLKASHPTPSLPCTLVQPVDGNLLWFADKLACAELE